MLSIYYQVIIFIIIVPYLMYIKKKYPLPKYDMTNKEWLLQFKRILKELYLSWHLIRFILPLSILLYFCIDVIQPVLFGCVIGSACVGIIWVLIKIYQKTKKQ